MSAAPDIVDNLLEIEAVSAELSLREIAELPPRHAVDRLLQRRAQLLTELNNVDRAILDCARREHGGAPMIDTAAARPASPPALVASASNDASPRAPRGSQIAKVRQALTGRWLSLRQVVEATGVGKNYVQVELCKRVKTGQIVRQGVPGAFLYRMAGTEASE